MERILKQDRSILGEGGLQRVRTSVAFLYSKMLSQEEVVHIASRAPKVGGRVNEWWAAPAWGPCRSPHFGYA